MSLDEALKCRCITSSYSSCWRMVMEKFNRVEVFSATKARDRNGLGERVTSFLRNTTAEVVEKVVRQSSDREFHCLTVVLFLHDEKNRRRWH